MSDRTLAVALGNVTVGSIRQGRDGRASFGFDEAYRRMDHRPVLGQWFEDDLVRTRVHRRRRLLPWFENLLPEGDLRRMICERHGLADDDDLGVLEIVGRDLPGAAVVGPASDPVTFEDEAAEEDADRDARADGQALRFSLAGVQLKLSMSRRDDRWVLPVTGIGGDWIAKIAWTDRYPGLAQNEFATMQWARMAEFVVPACELTTMASLRGVPTAQPPTTPVFAIERYDRRGRSRIHQEDMAQVLGVTPEQKYEHVSYEKLGKVVGAVLGEQGLAQWLARLVLVIATGNGDAHLKNWSLLYPNTVTPTWTPVYDQVCTIAYDVDDKLALGVLGTRDWGALDRARFARLIEQVGLEAAGGWAIVEGTIDRLRGSWLQAVGELPFSEPHRIALARQWQRVPVLRDAGGLP